MSKRHHVIDARGIAVGPNFDVRVHSVVERTITASTIRRHVRAMKLWSEYGYVSDTTFSDGVRVVIARKYVRGVENVHTLRIESLDVKQ